MTTTVETVGFHLINGTWNASGEGEFHGVNPADGQALSPAADTATPSMIDDAFAAAVEAHLQTRSWPTSRWAELLEAIAEEIEALGDELLQVAASESGLPAETRLAGERGRTTGQLRMFAAHAREGAWVDAVIDRADPDRKPLPKADIRRMLRPLGPVVIFDASNFPLAFGPCGGDTASALAAGNPVIVKNHPSHPLTGRLTAEAVIRAAEKAKFPKAVFQMVQGVGSEVGAALVQHPAAEAVGFTGSLHGGRALFDLATKRDRPIPFFGEMGSVNPLVLLPGALQERRDAIIDGLAGSITLGAGQFCTKPGVVLLVEDSETPAFIHALAEKLGESSAFTLLNPSIRDAFDRKSRELAQTLDVKTQLTGEMAGAAQAKPWLFEIDAAAWMNNPDVRHEVFGPAAMIVCCRDLAELVTAVRSMEGQLTGSIHVGAGDEATTVEAVAAELESHVGRLIFNGYPTGVEVCHAMVHGGPYPATTAAGTTSVGTLAIQRFARPVAYQSLPDALLPEALQNANPLGISRNVDGQATDGSI